MKFLGKLLATIIFISTFTNSALALDYPDLSKDHWAYKEINVLTKEGVLVGYPDGTFKPDEHATKSEFATMALLALGQENALITEYYEFKDVPYTYWAYDAIRRAVMFDLIKEAPDGLFYPENNISKLDAVSFIISAVDTKDMSADQAKNALKVYEDYQSIPKKYIVPLGKSEILKMTAHAPESVGKYDPFKKITRAEVAVNLYNMREWAKKKPNPELEKVMRAKKAKGYKINRVSTEGTIATIHKGAMIPVSVTRPLSSQKNKTGDVFIAQTTTNLVTKENYLLIAKGSRFTGVISDVQPGRYFVRNAKMTLGSKALSTRVSENAVFTGDYEIITERNWFMKIIRPIFKGEKINLNKDKVLFIRLTKPVRIDLVTGKVFE